MRSLIVQIVVLVLVTTSPLSCVLFPVYLFINAVFAFVGITTLLVTSRQVDNRLVVEKESGSGSLLEAWCWINVIISLPALLYWMVLLFLLITDYFQ